MDGDGEGRPEGRGEGRNEREDFAEYVEYLREKYGEGGGADAEKVESKQEEPEDSPQKGMRGASEAELERNEVDEFASYVEHLRQTYGPEGGSKAEDPTLEANVKTDSETDDRAESSNRADVQRELAESRQVAEPANASKMEGNTKAEEVPALREDQANEANPNVTALGREAHVNQIGVEQQAAETNTVEGHVELPQPQEDVPLKADGEKPRSE